MFSIDEKYISTSKLPENYCFGKGGTEHHLPAEASYKNYSQYRCYVNL